MTAFFVERIKGGRVFGWLRRFILGLGRLGINMVMKKGKGKDSSSRFIFKIGFLGRVISEEEEDESS